MFKNNTGQSNTGPATGPNTRPSNTAPNTQRNEKGWALRDIDHTARIHVPVYDGSTDLFIYLRQLQGYIDVLRTQGRSQPAVAQAVANAIFSSKQIACDSLSTLEERFYDLGDPDEILKALQDTGSKMSGQSTDQQFTSRL
jgi:hypothetical protein